MVPHSYPKTPGTQTSTQNIKIMVIFGFLVKASLNLQTKNLDSRKALIKSRYLGNGATLMSSNTWNPRVSPKFKK